MNPYIEDVQPNEESILRNMFEYYDYEFSQFLNFELNKDGLFQKAPVADYLSKKEYKSYFIKSSGLLLGFVIVKIRSNEPNHFIFEMEQFFILKKYSGKGIGKQAATNVFDRYKGEWKVTQVEQNYVAQAFWRKVIKDYTNNTYTETYDDRRRSVQMFNNINY